MCSFELSTGSGNRWTYSPSRIHPICEGYFAIASADLYAHPLSGTGNHFRFRRRSENSVIDPLKSATTGMAAVWGRPEARDGSIGGVEYWSVRESSQRTRPIDDPPISSCLYSLLLLRLHHFRITRAAVGPRPFSPAVLVDQLGFSERAARPRNIRVVASINVTHASLVFFPSTMARWEVAPPVELDGDNCKSDGPIVRKNP